MERSEAVTSLVPLIRAVARKVAGDWDGIAEPDDVEQEIWMELLAESSYEYVITLAEMEAASQQYVVNRVGRHVGQRMREDYYQFSGNYTYDTEEVRELLERGALEESDGLTKLSRSEVADVQIGMDRLKERSSAYWAAIMNYYVHCLPIDYSTSTEKNMLQRARAALTSEMNGTRRQAEAEFGGR